MYGWELFEGRDYPIPMRRPKFDTISNMKMVGLIILLTRALWIIGKALIMESGFCVLRGYLKLERGGFMEVH